MPQDLTGMASAPTTGRVVKKDPRRVEVHEGDLPVIISYKGVEWVLVLTKNDRLNLQRPNLI